MGKRKADADPSAVSWTAPTDEEFAELKRYKSFLLPPNNSYALGQFVWLAHDLTKPRKPIKQPRQSASSSAPTIPAKKNGADPKSELDHVEDALVKGQKKPGKYVRTEQDEEDDEKWDAAFWLGQIIEIRANGTSYVWMKIRWMCRKISELREQNIKSGLPKSHPGGREVFMLGPEFDALQPVGAVEGAARVVLFDERNPFQTPMDEKTIFYRSEARTPTGAELDRLKLKKPAQEKSKKPRPSELVPTGHLFPLREPTCYCGEAYRPILRPAPMAMCVNEGCYKWFHLGCLDWGKDYRIEATPGLLELIQTSGCELAEKFLSSYDDVAPVQLPDGVKLGELVDTMIVNGQSPRPGE
ncbi:hypothetical protein I316_02480 [Kwoniella heveanensis BCC8398]|uniref:BAH domain-containing protein n=1 Tax=Kwoniella heveanensis BCC8398 TaxID=1296120 RepID=A0A1B9GYF1_9TREE|nr:hypothetical protein I316_02480 [Kwoniella heveanensis BCC8398]